MRHTDLLTAEQEAVVSQVLDIYNETGKRPVLERNKALKARILACFPDYDAVLRAANLPVIHPTKEDLIESIHEFYMTHGRTPKLAEAASGQLKYSLTAYSRQYPLWNDLIIASGYKPRVQNNKKVRPPRRYMIRRLQRFALKLQRMPSITDLQGDKTMPSKTYYVQEFGSWALAKKAARLEDLLDLDISPEGMIRYLRDLAKQLGHTPSCSEMAKIPHKPGFTTFRYRMVFGSWNAAIIAAGLPTNKTDPRWRDTKFSESIMLDAENLVAPIAYLTNESSKDSAA